MAHKVTGQMSLITVRLGGLQTGTPTWALTASTLLGKRSTRTNQTAKTADLSSLEDSLDVIQVLRVGQSVDFELLVSDTGPQFEASIGFYAEVKVKAKASMSTPTTYQGVITAQSVDMPDGPTLERITLTGGANGYTAPP